MYSRDITYCSFVKGFFSKGYFSEGYFSEGYVLDAQAPQAFLIQMLLASTFAEALYPGLNFSQIKFQTLKPRFKTKNTVRQDGAKYISLRNFERDWWISAGPAVAYEKADKLSQTYIHMYVHKNVFYGQITFVTNIFTNYIYSKNISNIAAYISTGW